MWTGCADKHHGIRPDFLLVYVLAIVSLGLLNW